MWSEYSLEFLTVSFTNFRIDISTNNDLGIIWNTLQKGVEGLNKYFMGSVMTGVINRGKEDEHRFSFDSSSMAVKTVKFQIKADESARKFTSGCRRDQLQYILT